MDKYDLGAVYHDWDSAAVERLRTLCKDFGAGIVISSDWRRSKSTRQLQALFRVHDLHHYMTDATKETGGPPHPEIERFVIIDDGFREQFDELFPDDAQRARQILSGLPAQPNRALSQYGPLQSGLFGA